MAEVDILHVIFEVLISHFNEGCFIKENVFIILLMEVQPEADHAICMWFCEHVAHIKCIKIKEPDWRILMYQDADAISSITDSVGKNQILKSRG